MIQKKRMKQNIYYFKSSLPVVFYYLINNYQIQSNTTCNINYALQQRVWTHKSHHQAAHHGSTSFVNSNINLLKSTGYVMHQV